MDEAVEKLTFRCPNCDQALRVRKDHGGWIKTCPRCKHKIRVPEPAEPAAPLLPRERLMAESLGATDEQHEVVGADGPAPPSGPRSIADILLYPLSLAGAIYLVEVVMFFGLTKSGTGVDAFTAISLSLVRIVIVAYTYGYLAKCVLDSANGGIRAPGVLDDSMYPIERLPRLFLLGSILVLCVFPAVACYLNIGANGAVFWVLATWGIVTFPMAVLAAVVLSSTRAYDVLLLFRSIARAFIPYTAFVLGSAVSAVIVWIVYLDMRAGGPLTWSGVLGMAAVGYVTLILAHLLGLFYRTNKDRLGWDV